MDGAVIGGLLGTGLATLALGASVVVAPAPDRDVRTQRIIGRTWIAGIGILGVVVAILAITLESDVELLLGVALGLVIGAGAFGVLLVLRIAKPGPEARSRSILLMAIAESVSVLACIGLLVAVMLGVPA